MSRQYLTNQVFEILKSEKSKEEADETNNTYKIFFHQNGEKNKKFKSSKRIAEMRQNEIKNAPTLETRPGVYGGRVSHLGWIYRKILPLKTI